ncbi:hypothetical protein [Sphingopyxis sp. JAI128]|uniref:hypothetical protein n=1 Tax=Sphingopyxis sp. JAI128 TaxID=2723066 RepID=UPI0016104CA8|nr:hypothetical protein [Sphingopyxis sp. JAI128]MBB6427451.1 hypothetical protein [Sphingopyxis sp. JAI128]
MIRLWLITFLCLTGCASAEIKPTSDEMDRVETVLQQVPCVGDLDGWERRYFYHPEFSDEENARALKEDRMSRPTGYDRSLIEVDLREANFGEFRSGRRSYSDYPPGSADNDDRKYRMVFGTYDLKTRKLNLYHCGANIGPP